ncbi:glycosyltransferase family 4 protein [Corynebacterium heidelbergense]|uniref:Alpha-(1-2)-phosphatidylinositol mannosyltransferase n=1 Tax=Corynebacterium heidelbergense TaxID=2055947 RepID=A0A364V820_9CORY|nr:glycosyltransferase family 4 protein [Corynebacterium heidelbergense]RAV32716.1 alpha-(1-2)-phosphatidylinositol mannosyltransferase [Corynebacterium heidelbergense]
MRIGMVCPYSFDEPGGVQNHAIELCEELLRRGHHVSLIGPGRLRDGLPPFVELGGASIPIRYNGSVARLSFGPRTAHRIRRWIRAGQFDVVHIHEPNSPSYSMLTLAQVEGPIVATYHASASQSRVLRVALPVLRPMLERIQGGIAVSEEARRWQVEMLAGDPVLVPNGVATGAYRNVQPLAGLPPGCPRIMFLGRFDEPRKGLGVLLDAMPRILAQHPTVELVIAGGGSIPGLVNRIRAMGLRHTEGLEPVGQVGPAGAAGPRPGGVRILGRVSDADKAAALAASDIYVAPNTGGESFGIVLVEAMAAGAAVVSSDLPAFTAVSDHGRAAVHFPNGNSHELGDRLIELLSDPEGRRALAERGRQRSVDFDWESVTTRVEQVYDTVVRPGRKVTLT